MKPDFIFLGLVSCLAACAPKSPSMEPLASSATMELKPAEQVAEALVAASLAERAADPDGLRSAVLDLQRLRAEPATQPLQARIAAWMDFAAIDDPPMRGRTLGPAMRSGSILPGQSNDLSQTFLSGQKATIVARSSEGNSLQLSVYDNSGGETCTQASARALCAWIPIYTSRYTISVSNPGQTEINYFLVID